jgi:hypothetical protein
MSDFFYQMKKVEKTHNKLSQNVKRAAKKCQLKIVFSRFIHQVQEKNWTLAQLFEGQIYLC